MIFSVCVTDSKNKSEGGRGKTFFLLFPEFANSKIFLYFSESVTQTENIFFTLHSVLAQKSKHAKKTGGAANLAKKRYETPEGKHFLFLGAALLPKKVWGRRYANGEYYL